MNIKFRENFKIGHVVVLVDDKEVFSNSEYYYSAKYAKETYNLTDDQLMEIYKEYKKDYDAIKEGTI